MTVRPAARVLPHHPQQPETGVLLTVRFTDTGAIDGPAFVAACQRRDVEAMESARLPRAAQVHYPVIPSAWTARDLRRVARLMGNLVRPRATEFRNVIWDSRELHLVVAPPWGKDADPHPEVQLQAPGVPLAAVMELTGGDMVVTTFGTRIPIRTRGAK